MSRIESAKSPVEVHTELMNARIAPALQAGIVRAEKELGLKIKEIIHLPAPEFEKAKEIILSLIETGLQQIIVRINNKELLEVVMRGEKMNPWQNVLKDI